MADDPDHIQPSSMVVLEAKIPFANHFYFWTYTTRCRYGCVLRALNGGNEKLWEEGVAMWDEFRKEPFTLKAMIFVTINVTQLSFCYQGSSKERLVV